MKPEIERIASEYKAAYRAANGFDIEVDYYGGWFRLKNTGSRLTSKYRKAQVIDFTQRLRARPAAAQ